MIAAHCENVIVVLNVGGQVDLKEILQIPNVTGRLLHLVQPGMEGGNSFADVLTGDVFPWKTDRDPGQKL